MTSQRLKSESSLKGLGSGTGQTLVAEREGKQQMKAFHQKVLSQSEINPSTDQIAQQTHAGSGVINSERQMIIAFNSGRGDHFAAVSSNNTQSPDQMQQEIPMSEDTQSKENFAKSPFKAYTNNSNESMPIRSAQDQSQQSHNYDFLYDPEHAHQNQYLHTSYGSNQSNSVDRSGHSKKNQQSSFQDQNRGEEMVSPENPKNSDNEKTQVKSPSKSLKKQVRTHSTNKKVRSGQNHADEFQISSPGTDVDLQNSNVKRRFVDVDGNPLTHTPREGELIYEEYYIEEEEEEEVEMEEDLDEESIGDPNAVHTIQEVDSEHEQHSIGILTSNQKGKKSKFDSIIHLTPSQQSSNANRFKSRTSSNFKNSTVSRGLIESSGKQLHSYHSREGQNEPSTLLQADTEMFRPDGTSTDHEETGAFASSQALNSVNASITASGEKPFFKSTLGANHGSIHSEHHVNYIRGQSQTSFGNTLERKIQASQDEPFSSVSKEKLCLFAEKASLRMAMKELLVQLNHLDDVFARKNIQNDLILKNQCSSQLQLKAFLEINMNSNLGVQLSEVEKCQLLEEIKDKSNGYLFQDLSHRFDQIQKKVLNYFKGEQDILQSLAKERERNNQLEAELSFRKEDRICKVITENSPQRSSLPTATGLTSLPQIVDDIDKTDLADTEQFITELELQLQGARTDLLGAKLTLSDQQVEIQSLINKLEIQNRKMSQFQEDKKYFELSYEQLRHQNELLNQERLELTQLIRERESVQLTPIGGFMNATQPQGSNMSSGNQATPYNDTTPFNATKPSHPYPNTSGGLSSGPGPSQISGQKQSHSYQNQSQSQSGSALADLHRQIDLLNKQIYEQTKKQENMEVVETQLLESMDRKEMELSRVRDMLDEVKAQLSLKGEVVLKAQAIIQRFTTKSEQDDSLIKRLNQEKEEISRECNQKQAAINDLHQQMDELSKKQSVATSQMNEYMARELEEMRGSLRDYQQELDQEKNKYEEHVNSLYEQLGEKIAENERLSQAVEEVQKQLDIQQESNQSELESVQQRLRHEQDLAKEMETEMIRRIELVEESAKSQVKYLQNRVKEVAEEVSLEGRMQKAKFVMTASTCTIIKSAGSEAKGERTGKNLKTPQASFNIDKLVVKSGVGNSIYLNLRREFDGLGTEIIAIRDTVRDESKRGDALINERLTYFDEFRLKVVNQLIMWDEKTAELSKVAEYYYGALEEQRQMFEKMRGLITDKDKMIQNLQRQLIMREQSQEEHFNSVKEEIKRSNLVMKDQMLETISLLERVCETKEKQLKELHHQFSEQRRDCDKLLDDKNYFEQESDLVQAKLELAESELASTRRAWAEWSAKYCDLLEVAQPVVDLEQAIECTIRGLVEENKYYKKDYFNIREKLTKSEKDRDEEKNLLNQKVQSLEDQYKALQKSSQDKEEAQQQEFVKKGNELVQELNKAQQYADKMAREASTRERQLKKIQDKIEDEHKRYDELTEQSQVISTQNKSLRQDIANQEKEQEKLRAEISSLEEQLDKKQELLDLQREEHTRLKREMAAVGVDRDAFQEETRVTQLQNDRLVSDVQALESMVAECEAQKEDLQNEIERKNEEIFEEATQRQQVQNENDKLRQDVSGLHVEVDRLLVQLGKRDVDIKSYQSTVLRQTRELEVMKASEDLVEQQRSRIRQQDQIICNQQEEIKQLQVALKGPKKESKQIQTLDSGLLDIQYARSEVIKSQQCQEMIYLENKQLQEALQRSNIEVCRLIEDKRELEELVEKLNKAINSTQTSAANFGQSKYPLNEDKENNLPNQKGQSSTSDFSNHPIKLYQSEKLSGKKTIMGQILKEKECYISNLEQEMFEMRKELETQRDQLLNYEMASFDGQRGTIQDMSTYGIPGLNTSYQKQQPMQTVNNGHHHVNYSMNYSNHQLNPSQLGNHHNSTMHVGTKPAFEHFNYNVQQLGNTFRDGHHMSRGHSDLRGDQISHLHQPNHLHLTSNFIPISTTSQTISAD